MAIPRVFTIPPSTPFLPTLIRALLDGELVPGFPADRDPLALAAATLYLPTRRSCRLARDIFLRVTGQEAAILPRIVALGDVDEDEIAFAHAAGTELAGTALGSMELDLSPALGELERRLLLARLISKWAAGIAPRASGEAFLVVNTPMSALALAGDLARLIDDMTIREVSWDRLDKLVPEDLDRYWQLTLEFLKIARAEWPKILLERDVIEASARRDALIKAEVSRLRETAGGPVIAAGSTGSMPATAELIAAIATLPQGAVVLPGLDLDLDEESWTLIGANGTPGSSDTGLPAAGHPQFALHALLRRIGIARDQVATVGTRTAPARERYVSEALRPAAASHHWQQLTASDFPLHDALGALSVIEADNAEEEALAIAVALREAVEEGKTAALITPDRALARRVLAALARWDIQADDSAGDALPATPAGRFALLAAETALGGVRPVDVLALLKHPLMRLGKTEGRLARTVAALERAILRGPRPRAGTGGLAQALATFRNELAKLRRKEASELHHSEARADLRDWDLDRATEVTTQLSAALAPLEMLAAGARPLRDLAARHQSVIAALSTTETGECTGFSGYDGVKLQEIFDDVAALSADADIEIAPADYPALFKTVLSEAVVRPPERPDTPVRIYGPLEARLQSADRVVLGGLVEGVWPPEPRSDPWLSRPMRSALGLDPPERRISLSAHDFAQAIAAPEVVLAYPARLGGAPTVPSRFVQRLAAVAGEQGWSRVRASGAIYLAWARALDQPSEVKRVERPEPKPPRAARPASLSVTEIETWLRDPYSIYARHILRLRELDPVDCPPGAADRGIVIHGALSEFTKTYAAALPADPARALIEIGARHFAPLEDYPEARAFWWPRFVRIAQWFAAWEVERRGRVAGISAEIGGHIEIPTGERVFTLRARADRIEKLAGGGYAILDYKTGQVPTESQVHTGISPQLTLEAAILRQGGFADLPQAPVAELLYVSLKGGEVMGEARSISCSDGDADYVDYALTKLQNVVRRFEDEQQPYLPLVRSMWKNRYGSYDHLARVKEWSVGSEDETGPLE
jgi:ATP-dependent helicase/nuclease subunit B